MKIGRVVDLSHKLYLGREEYKLEAKRYFVNDLYPQYKRRPDDWYILHEITFLSHVGTHIEAPHHYFKKGKDISEIPLHKLIGEAVILDFTFKKPGEAIDTKDLQSYNDKIKEGDIVLIRTGLSKFYRTSKAHERPYIIEEAINWLIEKRIRCLGVDCSGIEPKGLNYQMNHEALFKNDIPLIESLTNLNQLRKDRVLLFILPVAIKNIEAFPVRVIAIEESD
ncbi:MAG: cyclase family protein [bacterium]